MLALNDFDREKIKKWGRPLVIFIAGFITAKLLPLNFHRATADEAPMVEKVSEDSLKLSDETLKNLTILPVNYGDVPELFKVMGKISVAEDKTAMVASRVSGRIESVVATSGAVVKAGDTLATIFSPDFAIAREEYLQTLAQIKASDDPEEKKVLALSRQKLEAMGVNRYDIGHFEPGQENSTRLVVRAPRAGAIIDKKAVVGNLVNPGDSLFTVGDTSSVWFAGDIYPTDLAKVHKGQEVVIDSENGSAPVRGSVSFISPIVDGTSRTIKIRAAMENPGNELRLDMYVRGNIILNHKTAMTVPNNALVRDAGLQFCFKEFPNHVFKRVQVETEGDGSEIVITKGLEPGDRIVSSGALLLESALTQASANP